MRPQAADLPGRQHLHTECRDRGLLGKAEVPQHSFPDRRTTELANREMLHLEESYIVSVGSRCPFLELAGQGYGESAESQDRRGDETVHDGSRLQASRYSGL